MACLTTVDGGGGVFEEEELGVIRTEEASSTHEFEGRKHRESKFFRSSRSTKGWESTFTVSGF